MAPKFCKLLWRQLCPVCGGSPVDLHSKALFVAFECRSTATNGHYGRLPYCVYNRILYYRYTVCTAHRTLDLVPILAMAGALRSALIGLLSPRPLAPAQYWNFVPFWFRALGDITRQQFCQLRGVRGCSPCVYLMCSERDWRGRSRIADFISL